MKQPKKHMYKNRNKKKKKNYLQYNKKQNLKTTKWNP